MALSLAISDEVPGANMLADYDKEHLVIYLRLLHSEAAELHQIL
jgi:hypothetical protein